MARLAENQRKRLLPFLSSTTPSETLREISRHVSRHGIRGVPSMVRVKTDTTWSATHVGLRPVESGLEGHEEGVIGVDDGVENASLLLWKRGRTVQSDHAAFSDFTGVDDENCSKNQIHSKDPASREVSNDALYVISLFAAEFRGHYSLNTPITHFDHSLSPAWRD